MTDYLPNMKELPPFTGFSKESVRFLKEIKENNCKEWFEERKPIYQSEILQPFQSLAAMLIPAMHAIDPRFETKPAKMISRIYRDVRFSSNKDPYRSTMWLNFQRKATHWENFPGFFAELSDEHFMYGMGLFMPRRKTMDRFREEVNYSPESFLKMAKQTLDAGFIIAGEEYKRPLANELPDFFQPWVQRKNIYVFKTLSLSDEPIYHQSVAFQLMDDFSQIAELYRFMADVVQETGQS